MEKRCAERNCGDEITNPKFKLKLHVGERETIEVNRCPRRLFPPGFSRLNTYVQFAEKYHFTPQETDNLTWEEYMYFLAANTGERLSSERERKADEAMQEAKNRLAKQTGGRGRK